MPLMPVTTACEALDAACSSTCCRDCDGGSAAAIGGACMRQFAAHTPASLSAKASAKRPQSQQFCCCGTARDVMLAAAVPVAHGWAFALNC